MFSSGTCLSVVFELLFFFNLIWQVELRSLGFCTWVDQLKRGGGDGRGRRSERRPAAGHGCMLWIVSSEWYVCCDRVKRVCVCVQMETGSAEPGEGEEGNSIIVLRNFLFPSSLSVCCLNWATVSLSSLKRIQYYQNGIIPSPVINSFWKEISFRRFFFPYPLDLLGVWGFECFLFARFNCQKVEDFHSVKLKWLSVDEIDNAVLKANAIALWDNVLLPPGGWWKHHVFLKVLH